MRELRAIPTIARQRNRFSGRTNFECGRAGRSEDVTVARSGCRCLRESRRRAPAHAGAARHRGADAQCLCDRSTHCGWALAERDEARSKRWPLRKRRGIDRPIVRTYRRPGRCSEDLVAVQNGRGPLATRRYGVTTADHATAAAKAAKRSPANGVSSPQVTAIGRSPWWLTYVAGPRNQKARSSWRVRANSKIERPIAT